MFDVPIFPPSNVGFRLTTPGENGISSVPPPSFPTGVLHQSIVCEVFTPKLGTRGILKEEECYEQMNTVVGNKYSIDMNISKETVYG